MLGAARRCGVAAGRGRLFVPFGQRLTSRLPNPMHTSVEPLEGNKVKLSVEVDEEEIRQDEDGTLTRLAREVRLPGFRPGRVPRKLIANRLGARALRQEVIQDAVPRYLEEAVGEQDLDVIARPEVDITAGEEGGPLSFAAVVEVRPQVSIPGYAGLSVTIPSPEVTDADVDAQLDRLREQFATLVEADRPAAKGDLVTLNVHGSRDGIAVEGLTADDLVYEVGTGGIVDGVDDRLVGAKAGDSFEIDAEDAPGGPAHLEVAVTLVREKVLPAADDEFASDASEFETLAELRDELRTRVGERKRLEAGIALREKAVEALSELVEDEPPLALVEPEAEHLLQDFVGRLSSQRIRLEEYLAAVGQQPDAFLAELRDQAAKQVKADLALRALVMAESLDVDESDLDEEIVRLAARGSTTPARLREALERDGRLPELRSQLKRAKALRWLVEHVAIVDEEGKPVDRSALVVEAEGDEQLSPATEVEA